jgi:hypothetical protein
MCYVGDDPEYTGGENWLRRWLNRLIDRVHFYIMFRELNRW